MSQHNVFGGDDSEDEDKVRDEAVTGFDSGVVRRYVMTCADRLILDTRATAKSTKRSSGLSLYPHKPTLTGGRKRKRHRDTGQTKNSPSSRVIAQRLAKSLTMVLSALDCRQPQMQSRRRFL